MYESFIHLIELISKQLSRNKFVLLSNGDATFYVKMDAMYCHMGRFHPLFYLQFYDFFALILKVRQNIIRLKCINYDCVALLLL